MPNPVLTAISQRRSIRKYEKTPLTKEQIDTLLQAALEAPSARNAQPWHFSVVQSAEILAELNAESAKNTGNASMNIYFDAPCVIFLSCVKSGRYAVLDCGIAVENIALAAHSMGLGSVILGMPDSAFAGDKKEYFEKLLKFPEGYEFTIAIALGVPATTKEAHPIGENKIDFI